MINNADLLPFRRVAKIFVAQKFILLAISIQMAAGTLLPLFWELASTDKRARLGSSHKLVTALQQFQDKFVTDAAPKSDETSEDDEAHDNEEDEYEICSQKLDKENAADVSYSVRRLIRGLASPRESSRLGFAVALTEVR